MRPSPKTAIEAAPNPVLGRSLTTKRGEIEAKSFVIKDPTRKSFRFKDQVRKFLPILYDSRRQGGGGTLSLRLLPLQ